MARAAKAPGTAVVSWDEKLAAEADIAAEAEKHVGSGSWFSIRGGILTYNGAPLPGNSMIAIVVDSMLENCYYAPGLFDPDNPQPPVCFAFGRDEDTMEPHESVFAAEQQQNDKCKDCDKNEWGSADRGRGKACKNVRRMALLPAGDTEIKGGVKVETPWIEPDDLAAATLGFLKIPVTSVNAWAAMVKQISATMRRPPHGVYMRISVVPDPKSQFRVIFEPGEKLDASVMDVVMKKRTEAMALIDAPYSLEAREAPPPKAQPAKGAARGRAKF